MSPNQDFGPPRFLGTTVRNGGSGRILELAGELDLASVERLDAELLQTPPDGSSILVVDLRGLTFMDSTGLKSMLQAEQLHRAKGSRLVLVRGEGPIQRVFEISGLEEHFEFVNAPEEIASDVQVGRDSTRGDDRMMTA